MAVSVSSGRPHTRRYPPRPAEIPVRKLLVPLMMLYAVTANAAPMIYILDVMPHPNNPLYWAVLVAAKSMQLV